MQQSINITPSAVNTGLFTLPIAVCRNWDISVIHKGLFLYAGKEAVVTFAPKHINYRTMRASAWQFFVTDAMQLQQLRMDGVYTYCEDKVCREKLKCDMRYEARDGKDVFVIEVTSVEKNPGNKATEKVKALLAQGIRPEQNEAEAPVWNAPSGWIPYQQLWRFKEVRECVYLWYASTQTQLMLYVGIVGDSKKGAHSTRSLYQRLREEDKKLMQEYGVGISSFRFCSLNNPSDYPVPQLLKTVEMAQITVLSSLFACERARGNIEALFDAKEQIAGIGKKVVLLNRMTSYKYVD